MLLNRHNFSIITIAKYIEGRNTLAGIAITKEGSTATDGRRLMVVSLPKDDDGKLLSDDEFPVINGLPKDGSNSPIKEEAVLDPSGVLEVLKTLPKKLKNAIPICNNFIMRFTSEKTYVGITDLNTERVIGISIMEGEYPKTNEVWPKGKPEIEIQVNPRRLKDIIDLAVKFSEKEELPGITLKLFSPKQAIQFEGKTDAGQEWKALLMPIINRTSD